MSIGRNDPCPCGSGEKYKKCCGKVTSPTNALQHVSDPSTGANLVSLAYQHLQMGQLENALQLCQQALNADPTRGDALHLAGLVYYQMRNLDLAEKHMASALQVITDDPWLYNNMGLVLQARGKLVAALEQYQHAIALKPDMLEANTNLGNLHKDAHNLDEAQQCYEWALANGGDVDPSVLYNLGTVFQKQGKSEEAARSYERVLALGVRSADVHNNLGVIFQQLLRYDEAHAQFQLARALDDKDPDLLNNIGTVYQAQKDYSQAEQFFTMAIELDPGYAGGYVNLGYLFENQGHYDKAIENYKRALSIDSKHTMAHYNYGSVLIEYGQSVEAKKHFVAALKEDPKFALGIKCLGDISVQQTNILKAIEYYQQALEIEPSHPIILHSLGEALMWRDRFDEAEQALLSAREFEPDEERHDCALASLYWRQSMFGKAIRVYEESLKRHTDSIKLIINWAQNEERRNGFPKAESLANQALLLSEQQGRIEDMIFSKLLLAKVNRHNKKYKEAAAYLIDLDESLIKKNAKMYIQVDYYHELGMIRDKQAKYTDAFEAFKRGNALAKESKGIEFIEKEVNDMVAKQKQCFSQNTLDNLPIYDSSHNEAEALPIFIVGFPRSGTTLTEQILCSHSKITAGDELRLIPELWNTHSKKIMGGSHACPDILREKAGEITQEELRQMRDYYLSGAEKLGLILPGVPWFTDKMPLNLLHLPLIKMLFPESPVIHIRRFPMDSCLSTFFQNFTRAHKYSYDIHDTAYYYDKMMELEAYYEENMDIRFMPIRYEDVIQDQEGMTRKILEFVRLDMEESCLQFHLTERVAKSASYSQVNQKIYTSSVYRSLHYYKQLKDIFPLVAGVTKRFGYSLPDDVNNSADVAG